MMLAKYLATAFLVTLFTVSQGTPTRSPPPSPKTSRQYRLGVAHQHMKNAGNALKESVKSGVIFPTAGAVGSVLSAGNAVGHTCQGEFCSGIKSAVKSAVKPVAGVALGTAFAGVHAGRAVGHVACAAGQVCGIATDRITKSHLTPQQRRQEHRDNGVRLAYHKTKSRETDKKFEKQREKTGLALAGLPEDTLD